MPFRIDGVLYPDREPPQQVDTLVERVDFLARLCAAWDFGILPDPEVVKEIRCPHWREAVDACRFLTSPTYHLLRAWHGLEPLPYLGTRLAYIADDPCLQWI